MQPTACTDCLLGHSMHPQLQLLLLLLAKLSSLRSHCCWHPRVSQPPRQLLSQLLLLGLLFLSCCLLPHAKETHAEERHKLSPHTRQQKAAAFFKWATPAAAGTAAICVSSAVATHTAAAVQAATACV
jgi:hypothetical protein